ncbi:enhanced serine sensitivity protein SseB [Rosenbergiella australiborealis]|uniref:Enhanced serine sensitivity protein SseB n=1 Tax=Rosenbergiella australiborealis TaxID=1544696 RepID=A0ABS5T710_9GAMM|nr:enhanced serine sensitivity protein SseB [Rosenbergiella australiborealis]MBT0728135.1 enhanced serine sensitivity protein SseB [Rosenbergiella australiborealis]
MSVELEKLLEQAATEPAYRPAFFQALLDADVWVLGRSVDHTLTAESTVELTHWEKADGESIIPFFTSEQVLSEVCESGEPWVKLPVKILFELTRGNNLFLNPKCRTGKEFSASEIAALLDNRGDALSEQRVIEGGETLLISAIDELPAQLVSSLTTLFAGLKPVRRAFLAEIREGEGLASNLLLGIEADENIDAIIQQAGQVAVDTLPDDALIDLCEITDQPTGISHFFTAHITPFYERRWGSFLRDFKGSQRIL